MGAGLSKHEDEIMSEARDRKNDVKSVNMSSSSPSGSSFSSADATATTQEASTQSACPMKKKDGSYTFDWGAMFRPQFPHGPGGKRPLDEEQVRERTAAHPAASEGGCPVKHISSPTPAAASASEGCPVKHTEYNVYSQPIDPKNNMPSTANQLPSPGQSKSLSTDRVKSSIPKGGTNEGTTWTYPSPQMFYNALARKGKLGDTDEQDISSVVALHNNMNEKTWRKVLEWEQVLAGDEPPKLLKFMGRPTDLSPKAMFKHYALGHPLPYDRHDWTVLRKDGTTVRYIIDYYHDETRAVDSESSGFPDMHDTEATPSLLVDVRPALDGPVQAWNRAVTMPYARRIADSTPFEPMPMRPTGDMQSQVKESIQVWDNIQAAASKTKAAPAVIEEEMPMPNVSAKEAKLLARNFSKALTDCRKVSERVKNAETEMDMAKARMDLSICMAKIVCPLQHGSLVEALSDESAEADSKIETAVGDVSECVYMKTGEHAAARQKYPKYFAV